MNSYEFHIGDYYRRTAHLSQEEHYIYRRLIDQCFLTELPLSTDLRMISRKLQLTSDQIDTLSIILKEFFELEDDGWHHGHVEQELERVYDKSNQARDAANRRWDKHRKNAGAMRAHSGRNADAMLPPDPLTPIPNKCPDKKSGRSKFKFNDSDMATATMMMEKIKVINPAMKEPSLESWANTIRLMRESDERDPKQIDLLFTWANRDNFWHKNILSADKFRKQWDTLFVQRQAEQNGGGRRLTLPRDDNELEKFAAKHGLQKPTSGDSFIDYRRKLNSEIEIKDKEK